MYIFCIYITTLYLALDTMLVFYSVIYIESTQSATIY